jgi:hypothetical protein
MCTGDPGDPTLAPCDLSRVQPAASGEATLTDSVPQVDGAANRPRRTVEGREHAVASGIHELTAVCEQRLANRLLEAVALHTPTSIADLARMLS